jgi:hypothetical protein
MLPVRRRHAAATCAGVPSMKWDIAENCRADIVGYSGINYSGDRYLTRIFPSGRQGTELPAKGFKSMAILAPPGTRVVLMTTLQDDWEESTWRCIRIIEGETFTASDGRKGVRVPDLDFISKPDAFRQNPEVEESYPFAKRLRDGKNLGWTFGRTGAEELKRGVVGIKVDKKG